MNSLIQFKKATPIFLALALVCLGLSPTAKALLPPPAPDGGYPGGNTAEGINALHDVNTAVGINNTAVGANALTNNTTGFSNTAVGAFALTNNTTGNFNMAIGTEALRDNNASFNLAIGFRVGYLNTTGRHLTGIGAAALRNNTTGSFNTAIGADAMRENTTASQNTAIGADALSNNTTGGGNTANGVFALLSNSTGFDNTAVGTLALNQNTTGSENNAFGASALSQHMTGDSNNAVGANALLVNQNGFANNAFGNDALAGNLTGNSNTAIGDEALLGCHGSNNTAIGAGAGANVGTAHNAICIGSPGADVSDSFYVANVFETSIDADNLPVHIDVTGRLGTQSSSRRFKKDIATMERASETILSLRPVTFHYKTDTKDTPQFGLIAEEVAKVNPALVLPDKEGKPYTVRYDAVNAMLLNEFLKEHRKVEKLEATIAQQHKDFEAAVAELKGQIRKVSAQLEVSKSRPKTVCLPAVALRESGNNQ